MQTITRKRYLDTLSVLKDKNLIKVATGVRRCGKSTLMTQFQELIRKENSKSPILAINMDMPEFRFLAEKNWKEIYENASSLHKNRFHRSPFSTTAYTDSCSVLSKYRCVISLLPYGRLLVLVADHVKEKWVPELRHHNPDTPIILVGTKIDLRQDEDTLEELFKNHKTPLSHEDGNSLAAQVGAIAYLECSSLTQKGLFDVFFQATNAALDDHSKDSSDDENKSGCLCC